MRPNFNSAFSLVEITLAVGIVAFAFVSVFSLVPIGLDVLRVALDTSVRSQIVQRLVSEAQQTDFDVLQRNEQTLRYFDDEGTESSAVESIYTALLSVKPASESPSAAASPNLLTVTVKVAKNPGRAAQPFAPGSRIPFATHVAFVARNQ